MKLATLLTSTLLVSTLLLGGCASDASSTPQTEEDTGVDSDLATTQRQAQLNGLRPRVTKDFMNVQATKLVFKVIRLKTEGDAAFISATIMKRDAAGNDSELSDADLRGSVYAQEIADGAFDGPTVIALLKKNGAKWEVPVSKDGLEAYVVGPTDVAWIGWDEQFNVSRSLLGM